MTKLKTKSGYPKSLTNCINTCWFEDDGKYSSNHKWEVALGGYDTGYEISYNRIPLFAIKRDNTVEMYQSQADIIRYCGYNYKQIMEALNNVRHSTFTLRLYEE